MELELRVPYARLLVRALGLLAFALWGWFLPGYLRYPLWGGIALLLHLGYLDELRPVILDRQRLLRGGSVRSVASVETLLGRVVLGVWPRFGVRFRDRKVWWLPLGPNWHLFWDALRGENPALPDWRHTPLAPYFLIQARGEQVRPEVPGELYEIAKALKPPLGIRGLAYVAGLLGYALASALLPLSNGPFPGVAEFFVGTLAGIAGNALDQSIRLRAYARVLSAHWADRGDAG